MKQLFLKIPDRHFFVPDVVVLEILSHDMMVMSVFFLLNGRNT